MRIAFYGASVTGQSISHLGEKTGYVPNVIEILTSIFRDRTLEFFQLGYGSNCLNDAGFVYFSELLEKNPDLVVMDWHSTWLDRFNPSYYAYMMDTLLKRGVKVVNVVFPMKGCIGSAERPNVQQARWYQSVGVPLVNLYDEIGSRIDFDICVRDAVHTTPYGGQVYGCIVAEAIANVIEGNAVPVVNGSLIAPPVDYIVPLVDRFPVTCDVGAHETLEVSIESESRTCPVRLVARLKIGPSAPVLDASCESSSWRVSVWDKWCHYDRICLKTLVPDFRMPNDSNVTRIKLKISDVLPPYSEAGELESKFSGVARVLSIRDFIYVIGGRIIDVRIA